MPDIAMLDRLQPVAAGYDLFLIDQWGVIHNGASVHAGAVAAMRALRDAGKKVVLISNSSKRADVSEAALTAMGVERALYDDVVTSGEIAWRALDARTDPYYAGLGRRCFMFTWGGDKRFLDGLDLDDVDTPEAADFVLLSGTSGAPVADEYESALQACVAQKLPMLCLNRDLVSVDPEGNLIDCTGKLAMRYEELGGQVRYHGKPGREIYQACLARAPDARRALAIGDSLHHDIAGANASDIDSVLVTGGIHAFDLGIAPDEDPDPANLAALCDQFGARPTYAMARFVW
jgi:HAD superfamily hydrolase (TIGR01459 family)